MEKYLLIAFVVIIVVGLIAYHLYDALKPKNASLDKAGPVIMIDEGVVMRIGVVSNQWGPAVHILLEGRPDSPVAFAFGKGDSAIVLTQVGDLVRLEREDADAEEYEFTNLTTGLSAASE